MITAGTWLLQEQEYRRIHDSNGEYTAIVTYRRYLALLPAFPGQSGDKPGFVRIEDSSGTNYGKIPVPLIWMSDDLKWTTEGAVLKLVGEWNFSSREYRYWNASQTKEIIKQLN